MINGTSVFREKLVLIKLVLVMYLTFLSGTEESKESKEARRAQTCLVQLQELSTWWKDLNTVLWMSLYNNIITEMFLFCNSAYICFWLFASNAHYSFNVQNCVVFNISLSAWWDVYLRCAKEAVGKTSRKFISNALYTHKKFVGISVWIVDTLAVRVTVRSSEYCIIYFKLEYQRFLV